MSRWEEKYNNLMPNIDRMIGEQTSKVSEARRIQAELGTNTDSAEYKQAKVDLKAALAEKERLEKLKPNLEKVKNIIEFRKQVEERLGEYYKVKDIYDQMDSNKKNLEKQQERYKEATEEIKKLTEKLQSGELEPEEKSKINAEISKMANQKQESLSTMLNLKQENDSFDKKLKELKYGEVNREEVNEQIKKLGSTVVKCDIACSMLMKGQSIEDIKYDPSKHKYTRPKAKEEKNNGTKTQEEVLDSDKEGKNNFTGQDRTEYVDGSILDHEDEGTDTKETSDEEKRIPLTKRIGNFFKSVKNRIFDRKQQPQLPEGDIDKPELTEIIGKNLEERGQLTELTEMDLGGREQLTDKEMDGIVDAVLSDDPSKISLLAEKGAVSLRDSIKVEKVNAAKAQLEANKKAAAARDRANHGDRYNEGK